LLRLIWIPTGVYPDENQDRNDRGVSVFAMTEKKSLPPSGYSLYEREKNPPPFLPPLKGGGTRRGIILSDLKLVAEAVNYIQNLFFLPEAINEMFGENGLAVKRAQESA